MNLSAVSETTLEARIRGYAPGAYTGASKNGGKSWFEIADGGILFLDEFQSVPAPYQIQFLDLLNAVSDRVDVARVSEDGKRTPYTVKVVLAINEDLVELLRTNRLRRDLLYRIRTIVEFPTLRRRLSEKPADLKLLLTTYRWRCAPSISANAAAVDNELESGRLHCLFPEFEQDALGELMAHDWPGNLRELERVASDLYWESDKENRPRIERRHATNAISAFKTATSGAMMRDPNAPAHLDEVENVLRKHKFVIDPGLIELKKYKIGSRLPLRRFLTANRAYLSADVAGDSRIMDFMKWR